MGREASENKNIKYALKISFGINLPGRIRRGSQRVVVQVFFEANSPFLEQG